MNLPFVDFALSYCANGELLSYINQREIFDEQASLFYAAEILLALEHMHKLGVVHRFSIKCTCFKLTSILIFFFSSYVTCSCSKQRFKARKYTDD